MGWCSQSFYDEIAAKEKRKKQKRIIKEMEMSKRYCAKRFFRYSFIEPTPSWMFWIWANAVIYQNATIAQIKENF